MLVTLNEIMAIATENGWAIGAFNTPNLECLTAVLNAAEELKIPVIIRHAEVHEPVSPLDIIGPIMVEAAKNAAVPVCVHLDHCETLSYMERALKMGFTGVMYDGSSLPYEENVKNTRTAVALAKKYGADVEAETLAMAKEFGIMDKTTFTSFTFDYIAKIKDLDPAARVGWLTSATTDEAMEQLLQIGGEEMAPKAEFIPAELMEKWRNAGLGVRAWGVSGVALMKKMCRLGVDGMTVNFPDRLFEYLHS